MKRVAALCGAVLLTLLLAAPAAALQKMQMPEYFHFEWGPDEEQVTLANWGFECGVPVYHGNTGTYDVTFWYPNGVDLTDPDEYMPEGVAWPWVKAEAIAQGFEYFSSQPGMGGTVISGKWKYIDHQTKHHPGTPGDPNDLESWQVSTTGNGGIEAPGYGSVSRYSGNDKGTVYIVQQNPGPYDDSIFVGDSRGHRGNDTWRPDKICAFFEGLAD